MIFLVKNEDLSNWILERKKNELLNYYWLQVHSGSVWKIDLILEKNYDVEMYEQIK